MKSETSFDVAYRAIVAFLFGFLAGSISMAAYIEMTAAL